MAVISPVRRPPTSSTPNRMGNLWPTGIHVQRIIYLIIALNGRYRENPQVYVIGNIFTYY
ncbi:MAG: hypothetical protein HY709_06585 [Candidatus Latescibacteria bacterium]|nr:hypothetical protein [Candidatus Latescibacterota bacterium]